MKGIAFVFLAFFLWQRPLRWLAGAGVLLTLLALPVFIYFDSRLSFALAICGFSALLGLPYVMAPIAFRGLISNTRLSMLPNFHLSAGLALLLMTLLVSAYLPLAALLTGAPASPLLLPQIFIGASINVVLMQVLVTSRHQIAIFSFLPFVVLVLLNRYGDVFLALLLDPVFVLLGLPLCVAGWTWGLFHLHHNNRFRPVYRTQNKEDWLYFDFGWSNRQGLGKVRTPAGTLLLGYPDGLVSRVIRILNFTLVSPLVCVLFIYMVGWENQEENPVFSNPALTFLLFCLFSSLLSTWNYQEMAARCRMLWLRLGGGRQVQWHFMENTILLHLVLLYCVTGLTALLVWVVSDLPFIYVLHFMALLITRSLFDVYYNLMVRVKNWPVAFTGLIGILSGVAMFAVIAFSFTRPDPFLILLVLEIAQLLLAAIFRFSAFGEFRQIDWRRIMLKPQTHTAREKAF